MIPISPIEAEATTHARLSIPLLPKFQLPFRSLEISDELCWSFYSGKCGDGVSEECDTTPCAPTVAPSLRTFQTTETSCGSECSRDHDVCLTAHGLPARCCAPGRLSRERTAQTGRRSDSSKLRQGRQAQGTNLESWRTTDAST